MRRGKAQMLGYFGAVFQSKYFVNLEQMTLRFKERYVQINLLSAKLLKKNFK